MITTTVTTRNVLAFAGGRLGLRVALTVFLSILAVEGAILVPSYLNYERDLLLRLEQAGRASVVAGLSARPLARESDVPLLARSLNFHSDVAGGAIYGLDGSLLGKFGEPPELVPDSEQASTAVRRRNADGSRLDVYWPSSTTGLPMDVVGRLDATWVKPELIAFVWRILGLVLMISVVVCGITMLIVRRFVLNPILLLRRRLIAATDVPCAPEPILLPARWPDELSEVMEAFNHMTRQIAQHISTLREARAKLVEANTRLEVDVNERTKELVAANEGLERQIAERERAEELLNKSETLFRALVNHSPTKIYMKDMDGRYTLINPLAEKLFGVTDEEGRGKTTHDLFAKDQADAFVAHDQRVMESGEAVEMEEEFTFEDGVRTYLTVKFPIRDPVAGAIGVGAIGTDITKHKKIEQELRQAQKMEAVGQLTGGVAHDFNNLLTVILGNLQLLERQAGDDERLHKRIAAAAHAARRGAELTNRLLAFSRRQVLEPKVLDLNGLVCGMDDLLRRTLGEDTEIETVPAANLWPTEVDPAQVETSLLNLAVNARHAMEDGGRLTIETANAKLDEDYAASHDGVTVGDYVMLAVTDTGCGMPPEIVRQVFEPFFTTKETGEGTGLGLSMVYGFVKQSGGYIDVYSEEGHGTTVRLYFPRSASSGAPAATEASGGEEIPRGTETVLVVEDDASVREVTVAMLEEFGYRALQAESGADALAVLDEHPDIDLLFTDVVMPGGMSGPALGKQAQKRRPRIRVLYTSGYSHSAFLRDGKLDPDVGLIGKPFKNAKLAREVRRILDEA